jgi:hypothetical protein
MLSRSQDSSVMASFEDGVVFSMGSFLCGVLQRLSSV